MNDSFYPRIGKRWFDLACSGSGLLLLAPLLAFIAIIVKLTSHGPVIFRQVRTGRHGKPFQIWKFRTMTWEPTGEVDLITAAGDQRVTPFGHWLRKTKFDELPQLFNVVKGEMSLVGPRPEVPRFTNHYTDEQRAVLSVRPGITGPTANRYISEEALLAGHADKEAFYLTSILPAKLALDLHYCNSISFNRDLNLIAHTFRNLLLRLHEVRPVIPDTSGKNV